MGTIHLDKSKVLTVNSLHLTLFDMTLHCTVVYKKHQCHECNPNKIGWKFLFNAEFANPPLHKFHEMTAPSLDCSSSHLFPNLFAWYFLSCISKYLASLWLPGGYIIDRLWDKIQITSIPCPDYPTMFCQMESYLVLSVCQLLANVRKKNCPITVFQGNSDRT